MKRTANQRLAGRTTSALVVLVLSAFALFSVTKSYDLARELWLIRATGWAAFAALLLALAMTPADRVLRRLKVRRVPSALVIAFRRSLGISSAVLALAHGALTLVTYLEDSWVALLHTPYLRAGLVALAILAALLITSFPEIVALLRVRLWRELHRLAYAAVFFAFQHLLMSPFASRRLALALLASLLLIEALRFLPRPGK